MRIAFFGGSFDPPHRGHVAIARAAADAFALDTVLFAPAGRQPLKAESAAAPYKDRLAMVSLLAPLDPRFAPSSIDGPRPDGGLNYSVDTLEQLAASYASAELFALAGADSFHSLGHWREPRRLLALAQWIVVSRPGVPPADLAPAGLALSAAEQARIHPLDTVHVDIAATQLRERLGRGEDCSPWLTPEVAAYIATRGLYRGRGETLAQQPA